MIEAELFRKFNIVSRYTTHTPETVKRPWMGDFISSALETSQHVFFGEPHINGNMVKTYELLAQNPEIFAAAAKGGARHFVVEFPDMLQEHMDKYAAGKMDRESFKFAVFRNPKGMFVSPWLFGDALKQFQSDFVQAVDNALAAGMKVHLADYTWDKMLMVEPPEGYDDFMGQLLRSHRERKSKKNRDDFTVEYLGALPSDERERITKMLNRYEADKRNNRLDDTEQHMMLRLEIPKGEGILGVVGLGHLDDSAGNRRGINYLLEEEGEKVAVVEIYDSRNTCQFVEELQKLHAGENRKPPAFTLILEEDAVVNKDDKPVFSGKPSVPPAFKPPGAKAA